MLNPIFIKMGFTVSGWEGLIFKFSLLICLGWWHLLVPGLLTKNNFSLPPLSLWTFVHFHVKLVVLFAFSMFTFFLFPHLHLAPGGTKTPPSLTQGVVLRACTFCILVGNNSQVHFFFSCALLYILHYRRTHLKSTISFSIRERTQFFFAQNLKESSFVCCSLTTHEEHLLDRKPIIALLFTIIVFRTLQDSIQHIAMCSNVHCYVSDTL